MYLEINCPACNTPENLELKTVGEQHECRVCHCRITVPGPGQSVTEFLTPAAMAGQPAEGQVEAAVAAADDSSVKAHNEGLSGFSGIALIAVGCGQLFYSLMLVLNFLFAGSLFLGKLAAFIGLASFAVIPQETGGWLDAPSNPVIDVFLPTMVLGTAMAIAAFTGAGMVFANRKAGKRAIFVVALCAGILFLVHLRTGMILITSTYVLITLLAASYLFRSRSASPDQLTAPLPKT